MWKEVYDEFPSFNIRYCKELNSQMSMYHLCSCNYCRIDYCAVKVTWTRRTRLKFNFFWLLNMCMEKSHHLCDTLYFKYHNFLILSWKYALAKLFTLYVSPSFYSYWRTWLPHWKKRNRKCKVCRKRLYYFLRRER